MLELRMDTDLQTALPSEIGFNFEELKSELAERLEHYNNLVVTEDGLKEAKADRAKLNKLRTAIDTRRKDIKKEYMKPYTDFEGKIKELTLLIDQPIKAIDTQLESYEERRKQAKLEKIQDAYEETLNAWSSTIRDIIPLERILDPKWLNATTSMKSVGEDLENWAKRVNADLLALDTVEEAYQAAVREKYIATLDVSAALAHMDSLKAAEEAFRARAEEKKAREQEEMARAVEKAAEAKSEPQIDTPEPSHEQKLHILRLEFQITKDQALALREFLDNQNISYRKF